MAADIRQYLALPDPVVDEQSPFSAGSAASDASLEFSTPLPFLDASPQPQQPQPPGPSALRRSTSAPYYQPSLPSTRENASVSLSQLYANPPPTLPLLAEQPAAHRPYLSLDIGQFDEPKPSPSPQPASHRKSRSYSHASPTSPGQSATSSFTESPSPSVELSPMHKRLKARGARALSVGSAQPLFDRHRTYSPARSRVYSPSAERKDDSDRPSQEVVDVSSQHDYWAVDDDMFDLDEAVDPPTLASTRYPSLRSIYRKSSIKSSALCPPCSRPRLVRCCGGVLRCGMFSLFVIAFVLFVVVMVVQFRGATLYSNNVCRPLDTTGVDPNLPYTLHSVIKTQTTLPKSKVYVVAWNVLNAFFGMFSLVQYTSTSILSAVTRRVRVPAGFNSSAPLLTPNYTGSPLLSLPLNHFRIVGSHNSYHMKSSYPVPAHQYGHAPLPAQLGDYSDGVRQIEVDIHVLQGEGGSVIYHVQLLDDHTNCYCLTECLLLVWPTPPPSSPLPGCT